MHMKLKYALLSLRCFHINYYFSKFNRLHFVKKQKENYNSFFFFLLRIYMQIDVKFAHENLITHAVKIA